jgi:hypothetical protein
MTFITYAPCARGRLRVGDHNIVFMGLYLEDELDPCGMRWDDIGMTDQGLPTPPYIVWG